MLFPKSSLAKSLVKKIRDWRSYSGHCSNGWRMRLYFASCVQRNSDWLFLPWGTAVWKAWCWAIRTVFSRPYCSLALAAWLYHFWRGGVKWEVFLWEHLHAHGLLLTAGGSLDHTPWLKEDHRAFMRSKEIQPASSILNIFGFNSKHKHKKLIAQCQQFLLVVVGCVIWVNETFAQSSIVLRLFYCQSKERNRHFAPLGTIKLILV